MKLAQDFIDEMNQLFRSFPEAGDPAAFWDTFDQSFAYGLRTNSLKISPAQLVGQLGRILDLPADQFEAVPWSDDGFYLPQNVQPGRLSLYAAGLYYIQEPSAMLPAAVLAASPGELVLDICAAPGGKSARIAADLQGEGLLWSNDLSQKRIRALLRNLEMTGCRNSLITCADPKELASQLPAAFDAVLVDAPCSGSGMFRRDPSAVSSWLDYGPAASVPVQRDILQAAWKLLKPGGRLVYSTCSFSLAENEENIVWLLDHYSDAEIKPINKSPEISDGLMIRPELRHTARIWPHHTRGDGHFCALLQKRSADRMDIAADCLSAHPKRGRDIAKDSCKDAFFDFVQKTLSDSGKDKLQAWLKSGWIRQENNHLHWLPERSLPLENLKKIKTGLFLGQVKAIAGNQYRFEPSQAFLLGLQAEDFARIYIADAADELINRYLKGETIQWPEADESKQHHQIPGKPGEYAALAIGTRQQAYPVGWLKIMTPPLLKNLYPQSWRKPS